jgi:hypothetical protein
MTHDPAANISSLFLENIAAYETLKLAARVTRLGELSPNGSLLPLGSYLKITEVSHTFGLLYSLDKFQHKF